MLNNDQNPILPKESAQTLLQPYFQILIQIINGAWAAWEQFGEIAPGLRSPLSASCRARFVYDHIVALAKVEFDTKKGVRLEEKRGFLLIHIDNLLTIRFKKFNSKLRSSNIQTRQQVLFALQMDMPGLPKSTRLVAGYKLDELAVAIEQIAVTCPNGNKLEYIIEVPDDASGADNIIAIGPTDAPIKPADVVAKNVQRTDKEQNKDE